MPFSEIKVLPPLPSLTWYFYFEEVHWLCIITKLNPSTYEYSIIRDETGESQILKPNLDPQNPSYDLVELWITTHSTISPIIGRSCTLAYLRKRQSKQKPPLEGKSYRKDEPAIELLNLPKDQQMIETTSEKKGRES